MRPLVYLYLLIFSTFLCASETPILQIDSGGHLALIKDIAFTKDGKFIVSAGVDKAIRIWDIEKGKTVRIIRGPATSVREGQINAMALSTDDKWLAVGGWMDSDGRSETPCCGDIRVFDFSSGKLAWTLTGHTSVVTALAFSSNNRWLVSGSFDNSAIVWNVKSRTQHRILKGHTEPVFAAAFTHNGQHVVTGSGDNNANLWRVSDGNLITTMRGHTDDVRSLAVTPDNRIVTGSYDQSIRLWSGRDGEFLGFFNENYGNLVGGLSVSGDGKQLLVGAADVGDSSYAAHLYNLQNSKLLHVYSGHKNITLATAISPNNQMAATAGGNGNEIDIWSTRSGKQLWRFSGIGQMVWNVGFDGDGRTISWGKTSLNSWKVNRYGDPEYKFRLPDILRPLVETIDSQQDKTDFIRERVQTHDKKWTLQHKKGGKYGYPEAILEISHNGELVKQITRSSYDGYRHLSYSFTPDDQSIISGGGNGHLTMYDLDGNITGEFVGHNDDIWSTSISADGQFLLSGSADQTVKMWSIPRRELIFTLFHTIEGEWVAWTPQGYYDASLIGDSLIGWHINRGMDKAAEYVSASQLKKYFYRPDILADAIRLGSSEKAVALAADTEFQLDDIHDNPPPRFKIAGLKYTKTAGSPLLEIGLDIDDEVEIDEYKIYVDGRYVEAVSARYSERQEHKKTITIPIPGDAEVIEVAGLNIGGRTVKERSLDVPDNFFRQSSKAELGDLYLVSIGINQYPFLKRNLEFAENDATTFHQLIKDLHGVSFNRVHHWLLSDSSDILPTVRNIKDALAKIKKARVEDTVIVYFAGHGEYQGKDYFFLSSDSQQSNDKLLADTAVRWTDIQAVLNQTRGQRILVIDSCYSEKAYNPRLIKDAHDEGIAVFTSTDDAYAAQEMQSLEHGVFTHALLKGLKREADSPRKPDNKITLSELESFVVEEVVHLTKGQQRPQVYLGQKAKHYVINEYQ